jgi:hypothetical protein
MTFDELIGRIEQATDPADLFGDEACTDAAALRRCYLRLASILHPDRHPNRVAEATAAFQRLQRWRDEAHRRLQMTSTTLHITTRQRVYRCDEPPLPGDLSDLFPSTAGSERVVVKIVRHARNNDLLQAEADALRTLDRALKDQAVRAHFPSLLEMDPRNQQHPWQGGFRVGWLDLVMLRYACEVVGSLDMLAVTCLDRLAEMPALQICRRYRCDGASIEQIVPAPAPSLEYQESITHTLRRCRPVLEPVASADDLLALLARNLNTPIGITSWGPTAREKQTTEAGSPSVPLSQIASGRI